MHSLKNLFVQLFVAINVAVSTQQVSTLTYFHRPLATGMLESWSMKDIIRHTTVGQFNLCSYIGCSDFFTEVHA